jgi:hypothetical protein
MTNTLNNELLVNLPNLDEEQLTQFRNWLIGILKVGPAVITFNKKDGSERVMTCSLQPELLPPAPIKESTTTKKENTSTISVYDLNAQGWRSFIVKNVTNVTLEL